MPDIVIVGAGLSGLCTAHFLDKFTPGADIVLLEQESRAGGAIQTFHQAGFLAEWGAHGFLDNIAESRELLEDTGLNQEAQKAPLGDFVRYICLNGQLNLIPQSPKKILASSLLPFHKKLRVLADLWIKPLPEEQPVGSWASRRFGKGVLPFVDAVLTGTYAGDLDRLDIDAVMPGIRKLELEHGSVIRGLLHKKKLAGRQQQRGTRQVLPAMISFAKGMARLPEALARNRDIRFDTRVTGIDKTNGAWTVQTTGGPVAAGRVVLAMPVNQTIALLSAAAAFQNNIPPMTEIPVARIATVALGFTNSADIPFGFGYLAPESEHRFALGALFSTHMFPGRAPAGHVMLEALVGGRRHPERLELDDQTMVQEAYQDISQLIHLPEPPVFSQVLRGSHGIPQLEAGYPKLLAWRNTLEQNHQGLFICGFGWEGIGMNDMIKVARRQATNIAAGVRTIESAEIKPVYF